jgi:hypothetical protein
MAERDMTFVTNELCFDAALFFAPRRSPSPFPDLKTSHPSSLCVYPLLALYAAPISPQKIHPSGPFLQKRTTTMPHNFSDCLNRSRCGRRRKGKRQRVRALRPPALFLFRCASPPLIRGGRSWTDHRTKERERERPPPLCARKAPVFALAARAPTAWRPFLVLFSPPSFSFRRHPSPLPSQNNNQHNTKITPQQQQQQKQPPP